MVTNFDGWLALHSDGCRRFYPRRDVRALVLEMEDDAGCEALLTNYLTELADAGGRVLVGHYLRDLKCLISMMLQAYTGGRTSLVCPPA